MQAEAQPATGSGPLLRRRLRQVRAEVTGPHDDQVPVDSFKDDLDRKVALRRVMYDEQGNAQEPHDQGAQYTKDEVNYRYASNPQQSCGTCKYFVEPGACQIVAGMIRPIDVCDKWEAQPAPAQAEVPPDLENGDEYWPKAGAGEDNPGDEGIMDEQYDAAYVDPGANVGQDDCPDYMLDTMGRCPHDPLYMSDEYDDVDAAYGDGEGTDYGYGMADEDETEVTPTPGHQHGVRGMTQLKPVRAELAEDTPVWCPEHGGYEFPEDHVRSDDELEVTPPGFEPVVKALKRRGGVRSPWAVAWAMKKKGIQPKGDSEDEMEVTPPGFEKIVKGLKRAPGVEEPYAVAWWMKKRGYQPRGDSEARRVTFPGGKAIHFEPGTKANERHVVQAEFAPRRREQLTPPTTTPGGSGYSGPSAGAGGGAISAPSTTMGGSTLV